MYSSQTMPSPQDSMPEKVKALNDPEELAGFMFMFDHLKLPICSKLRVLELPELTKEVLKKIRPGMYLFFYDILSMFLYGIYTTTSSVKIRFEESDSGQKFSAQVEFQLLQDFVPLTGRMIKHVIQDNFHKGGQKFSPELNLGQVESLSSLFISDPINTLISKQTSVPELYMQYQTSKGQAHLPASPLGVQNAYSAGNSGSFSESVPEPQPTDQNMPYQSYQPEHRSLTYMGDTIRGPSSQSSLLAHQIPLSPQTDPSFSLLSFAGVYDEPPSDPQHTSISNPQSNFHSPTVNMSSSQAQTKSDPQYVNQNVLNPQPNLNPNMNVGCANPIVQSYDSSSPSFAGIYDELLADPQHTSTLNPQSNFHSSTVNMSSSQAQSKSDPQYVNQNVLNPQPNFTPNVNVGCANPIVQSYDSSSPSFAGICDELLADPQHTSILNPQSNFHSSMVNMSSSQGQSKSDPQYVNQNVLNPQPNFTPNVNVGCANPIVQSYDSSSPSFVGICDELLADPQHTSILNPQSNFHSSMVNMSSSQGQSKSDPQYVNQNALNPQPNFNPYVNVGYANPSVKSYDSSSPSFVGIIYDELLADPQHTSILNPQSNFHSSTVNMSSSQAESKSDPQYVNQNVLNPQPNFNPSVDMGYVNPIVQSHASSSVPYYSDQTGFGYIPEAVTSAAYPYQGVFAGTSSEAAEGIMHGDQQTGAGNECFEFSLPAWIDDNHQQ